MQNYGSLEYSGGGGVPGPGSITNTQLANMPARTVKVNATNAAASPQDLQGTTALTYLRVNSAGTGLEWGAVAATTFNFTASPRLLGRTTAGAGAGEEISVSAALTLTGLTLGTAAITGDVAVSANGVTSTIGANKVVNSMLAQGAARTVVGVAGNATANRADIAGGGSGTFLRDSGTALAFSALSAGDFPSNTIALASLANAAAQYDIVGRKTASGGAWEDCTLTQLTIAGVNLANSFSQTQTFTAVPQFNGTEMALRNAAATGLGQRVAQRFFSKNSAGTDTQIGLLDETFVANTAGAEYAALRYFTIQNGVLDVRVNIGGGLYSFNAAGGDPGLDGINFSNYYANGTLNIDSVGLLRLRNYTVATLPATAGKTGATACVTDALGPVFASAVTGGGAVTVPVYVNNGGVWAVG